MSCKSRAEQRSIEISSGTSGHLDEISTVTGIETWERVDLSAPPYQSGCIYIVGSLEVNHLFAEIDCFSNISADEATSQLELSCVNLPDKFKPAECICYQ